MTQYFVPYVYFPSDGASYIKFVTPYGNYHVEKHILYAQIVMTIVAGLVTAFFYYRFCVKKRKWTALYTKGSTNEVKAERTKVALEENVLKKGRNTYYYAHDSTDSSQTDDQATKSIVSSYGWTDDKDTISIYVTEEGAGDISTEQIHLDWTPTSLSLDVTDESGSQKIKQLVIPTLFNEIENVTWRIHKQQLIVTLTKKQVTPWTSLNGAAKNMDDHIQYDDSLFD